ncbi:GTP 3',8-cyclase MoaA [Demequina salsinemoris]|uniref:GTP 3',8-cyclase MoaA n=1 Tax=Demequina salsinemoris TaxID=577470 RepID=UPI0007815EAD|nr:GTP 3',8-cyclase MoaA [Demequina salsinemoris]
MGGPVTLTDTFGRVHRDLRISLTDRCSLRCTYCMPAEGVPWLQKDSLLTTEEIVRVARVAVEAGVSTLRLTGGEPLLRPDVVDVVSRLSTLIGPDGPPEISLTTNALALPRLAQPLVEAGLTRVNISLDTLRQDRFVALTRRDRLDDTLAGIDAAVGARLAPVKINTVVMRGRNDDEIVDLAEFAAERGLHLRFIEQMPLDAGHTWDRGTMVEAEEILAALTSRWELTEMPGRGADPAQTWLLDGGPTTIGVIASVTRPFCGACDRIRLTADGQLRACLFARTETDVLSVLRSGASDAEIDAAIRRCLLGKKAGHDIDDPGFLQPSRPMSAIGG